MLREEAVLKNGTQGPDYAAYRATVRWRIVPFLFWSSESLQLASPHQGIGAAVPMCRLGSSRNSLLTLHAWRSLSRRRTVARKSSIYRH